VRIDDHKDATIQVTDDLKAAVEQAVRYAVETVGAEAFVRAICDRTEAREQLAA